MSDSLEDLKKEVARLRQEIGMQSVPDNYPKNKYSSPTNRCVFGVHDQVFLLDVSSSMEGVKIKCAKEALKKYIKPGDGLITFGENLGYISIFDIDSIHPDGDTAMLPAIDAGVSCKATKIILITDGQPNNGGNQRQILRYVSGLVGVRINTIGIGRDCDFNFLEMIARLTGGREQFIDDPKQLNDAIALLTAPPVIALA